MAFAGRNDPCPCGSGRKYKRCCGFDRAAERVLAERLAAIEEIARLAYGSPRLVPESDAYDTWVRSLFVGELTPSVDAALATLDADEAKRIVGAVAAGIRDHRPVERTTVELVEESEDFAADPFEALALCLDGAQLWSAADGLEVDRAIGAIPDWVDDDVYELRWQEVLAGLAAASVTEWHARRLARLVDRIARQLPFEGFPRAGATIAMGCERFAGDEIFRRRLASTLLGDLVGRRQLDELRALLVA